MPRSKKKKQATRKKSSISSFFANNWLLLLAGFLISFIPLYPKLPLFDAIPGYIVRVRLEDIFIFITAAGLGIQVLRKKITLENKLSKWIIAYIGIGFLSVLSALFLIQTVPLHSVHIAKTVLHFLRYIEYFLLFFIVFSAIRKKEDIQTLLGVLLTSTVLVIVYGIGQKYAYWPVYSTMNREFSKGIRLYLTEHARVQSTFGGHYDLAGYLVIVIPLIGASIFYAQKKLVKLLLWIVFLFSVWLLTVSASRISYGAYVVGISTAVIVAGLYKESIRQKIWFIISRLFMFGFVTLLIFEQFGTDIRERMMHFLDGFPEAKATYVESQKVRQELATNFFPTVRDLIKDITKPDNAISTDEAREVITATDSRPSKTPPDVYVEVPEPVQIVIGQTIYTVEKERTYSENAQKYGLSLAIRLDTLWPQAIRGFQQNPLLGSGYATLTKASKYEFTEADSTDNNFLRTLGETGLLGFISFYGVIALAINFAYRLGKSSEAAIDRVLAVGYIGAAIGLLINALFIDVFAASKVAFIFWALTGLMYGAYTLQQEAHATKKK